MGIPFSGVSSSGRELFKTALGVSEDDDRDFSHELKRFEHFKDWVGITPKNPDGSCFVPFASAVYGPGEHFIALHHGTLLRNMPGIMEKGLDPSLGGGELGACHYEGGGSYGDSRGRVKAGSPAVAVEYALAPAEKGNPGVLLQIHVPNKDVLERWSLETGGAAVDVMNTHGGWGYSIASGTPCQAVETRERVKPENIRVIGVSLPKNPSEEILWDVYTKCREQLFVDRAKGNPTSGLRPETRVYVPGVRGPASFQEKRTPDQTRSLAKLLAQTPGTGVSTDEKPPECHTYDETELLSIGAGFLGRLASSGIAMGSPPPPPPTTTSFYSPTRRSSTGIPPFSPIELSGARAPSRTASAVRMGVETSPPRLPQDSV